MVLETGIVVASMVAGVVGLLSSVAKKKSTHSRNISIKVGDSESINISSDVSEQDLETLLIKLREVRQDQETKSHESTSQSGFISTEFLLLGVPGIIALMFALVFLYLVVDNQHVQNYSTPKELGAAMTIILGYYFGVGASAAANKGKVLSAEDVKKLIAEDR